MVLLNISYVSNQVFYISDLQHDYYILSEVNVIKIALESIWATLQLRHTMNFEVLKRVLLFLNGIIRIKYDFVLYVYRCVNSAFYSQTLHIP